MSFKGLALTGKPGVGKSTIFNAIISNLRNYKCKVGGFSAPEVRVSGRRVGFLIVDLETERSGWLARAGYHSSIKIGRYGVIVDDVIKIGVPALKRALAYSHIIAIDEIGPMELNVEDLRNAIIEALSSDKIKLLVFHRLLPKRDPEVHMLLRNLKIIEITFENREEILKKVNEYSRWLASEAGCNQRGKNVTLDK